MASAEYQREWRKKNPGKENEYRRRQRKQNPDRFLWRNHGLRPWQRAEMVAAQDDRCCYCERPLPDGRAAVHIDHDHSCSCGKDKSCGFCRRGVACRDCNLIIGHAGDDPERLERIAANFRVIAQAARERISGRPRQETLPIDVKRAARQQAADAPTTRGSDTAERPGE